MNIGISPKSIMQGVGEARKIVDECDQREGEKNEPYILIGGELPAQIKKAQTIMAQYCNKNEISTAVPADIRFASCYLSLEQGWSIKRLVDDRGTRLFIANQGNQIASSAFAQSPAALSPLLELLIKEFTTPDERKPDDSIPDRRDKSKSDRKKKKK